MPTTVARATPAAALALIAVASVLVPGAAAQAFAPDYPNCLDVDTGARTIKSDADGVGAGAFPALNCTARITCPVDQGVTFNFVGEATGTAYFIVKAYRVLLGQQLPNYFPAWNPHGRRFQFPQSYDTNEVIIMYQMMTPDDTDRTGGFEISWNCFSNCPASAPPATITPDASGRGVVQANITGTPPIICINTLEAPTCPAGMRVSYDFVRRPEYEQPSGADPWWKLLWLQTPSPGDVIFPNSFNATEQYLEPRQVAIQTRSLYNNSLVWEVAYYCTPVFQVPAAGGTVGFTSLSGASYGAILSDPDGEGPIPYPDTAISAEWGIVCPYDTNVATTEISAIFGPNGNQVLTFTPVLGTDTQWRDQIVGYRNIPWGAPLINVSFASPRNDNAVFPGRGGFTVKYNCTTQCALGPPARVAGPSPLTLAREWTALQPWADMCRWEVDTSCGAEQNIKVTVVKAPLVSETFKLVVDYDVSWFRFVYPDKNQGSTLYLRRGPFNASVRVYATDAEFELRTECVNSAVCGEPWSQVDGIGGTEGVIASDVDGIGPHPFDASVECTKQITCAGDIVVSAQGALGSAARLVIEQTNADGGDPWRDYTGTFDEKLMSVTGPLTVRLEPIVPANDVPNVVAAAALVGDYPPLAPTASGMAGGFTVTYTCSATPPPGSNPPPPPPPAPTTTAAPGPTTTAAPEPTTTAAPDPSTTGSAPTTTVAPTTTAAPTPTTTMAPTTTAAPTNATNATLAAPEDDNIALIAGAAVGGLVGLILLCALILFVVLRVKNLTLRDEDGRWFTDGTKYTKGFDVRGDEELEALSGQRAQNDMMANDDLTSINLLSREAPSAANRGGGGAKPVIDHEDI